MDDAHWTYFSADSVIPLLVGHGMGCHLEVLCRRRPSLPVQSLLCPFCGSHHFECFVVSDHRWWAFLPFFVMIECARSLFVVVDDQYLSMPIDRPL